MCETFIPPVLLLFALIYWPPPSELWGRVGFPDTHLSNWRGWLWEPVCETAARLNTKSDRPDGGKPRLWQLRHGWLRKTFQHDTGIGKAWVVFCIFCIPLIYSRSVPPDVLSRLPIPGPGTQRHGLMVGSCIRVCDVSSETRPGFIRLAGITAWGHDARGGTLAPLFLLLLDGLHRHLVVRGAHRKVRALAVGGRLIC
jgi:hypothetical protein